MLLLVSAGITGGCKSIHSTALAKETSTMQTQVLPGIENFHQVSPELYRSAQPRQEDWTVLEAFGIKSVINLRYFGRGPDRVGDTAIVPFSLPVQAHNLKEKELLRILQLIQQAPKPVLIHCYHGSDRTGAAVAAYRIVFQNWTPEQALAELVDEKYGHHKNLFPNLQDLILFADFNAMRQQLKASASADIKN